MTSNEIELTVHRANLRSMRVRDAELALHRAALGSNIAAIERRIAELELLSTKSKESKDGLPVGNGSGGPWDGESEEDRTDRILSEKAEHEAEADRAERRDV